LDGKVFYQPLEGFGRGVDDRDLRLQEAFTSSVIYPEFLGSHSSLIFA
jgi:hypothetical protein